MCENRDLKEQIKKTNFSYKNLGNREVSTLTGLQSMTMFTWLLATVSDVIKPTGKLCRGNVLLMVLMKLKLNLTNNDLAMRFQTCPTQWNVREDSKSRIHVERAIERVKRFQILKNTLPISLIRHADSNLTICAAFTNLLSKLVNHLTDYEEMTKTYIFSSNGLKSSFGEQPSFPFPGSAIVVEITFL
ncbi:hypothetical protein MAR_017150 [Mya arenaria]|uniref:Uncharacterized protein n=1 Tax=Mya arenaria TaxID=6604 RepID=A0ABY7EAX9_MYAAR|nr:hypothetical protein MAR_017150 [Mya arenaria]